MNILVTGGAGFIGQRLAVALAEAGHRVQLLDNLSRGRRDNALEILAANPAVRMQESDLRDSRALDDLANDYDYVVHLAAILGVQNVLDRPYETLRDNAQMQETAIRFARRQKGLRRFVFASTSEVYAGSLLYLDMPVPTPEDTPLALTPLQQPRTSYMLSKIYGEAMVIHSGLPYTILRPHNVYGPRMGMAHVIPQLLEKAHRAAPGGTLEVYSVEHRRSFCYIDDAVEMIRLAMFSEAAAGQTLNLGAEGPEVPMARVAELVIATVGKPLTLRALPPTPGSPERRAPRMAKMVEATGHVAAVGLEEGIRRTYDWYRSNVFR